MDQEIGAYVLECRQFVSELAARLRISLDRTDLIEEGSTTDEEGV